MKLEELYKGARLHHAKAEDWLNKVINATNTTDWRDFLIMAGREAEKARELRRKIEKVIK